MREQEDWRITTALLTLLLVFVSSFPALSYGVVPPRTLLNKLSQGSYLTTQEQWFNQTLDHFSPYVSFSLSLSLNLSLFLFKCKIEVKFLAYMIDSCKVQPLILLWVGINFRCWKFYKLRRNVEWIIVLSLSLCLSLSFFFFWFWFFQLASKYARHQFDCSCLTSSLEFESYATAWNIQRETFLMVLSRVWLHQVQNTHKQK